jgi:hypothetical protein
MKLARKMDWTTPKSIVPFMAGSHRLPAKSDRAAHDRSSPAARPQSIQTPSATGEVSRARRPKGQVPADGVNLRDRRPRPFPQAVTFPGERVTPSFPAPLRLPCGSTVAAKRFHWFSGHSPSPLPRGAPQTASNHFHSLGRYPQRSPGFPALFHPLLASP